MESKKIQALRKAYEAKSAMTRQLWEAYLAAHTKVEGTYRLDAQAWEPVKKAREEHDKASAEARAAGDDLARQIDRERVKSAALRQPAKPGNYDALRNASKETVFLAIDKDGNHIAQVTTYATKSRTWGYTWRAQAYFPHTIKFVTSTISGYGYCKESTAVCDALRSALQGAKPCGGSGMSVAWESFQDAVRIICKLQGKDAKYIKSLRFVKC